MADQEKKVSLKLVIDPKTNKVLFAEAGKEFVDFLFQMLSLPVGTVVKLLTSKGMVGCLGRLYESIQGLNSDCLKGNLAKHWVLNPIVTVNVPLLSLHDAPVSMKLYECSYGCSNTVKTSDGSGTVCPKRHKTMLIKRTTPLNGGEYAKESVLYMVMDNLEVKQMTTTCVIGLISKSHIVNVGSLVEKQVDVGLTQGIAMLKASFETEGVLTTVFLGKKSNA